MVSVDHPRVRGDHRGAGIALDPAVGPPPRARGPPPPARWGRARSGTTPACAGTTHRPARQRRKARDHPRVRGDHVEERALLTRHPGPPPRARGPQAVTGCPAPGPGTTPACAGTTILLGVRIAEREDHPRVRGDHSASVLVSLLKQGPPPRARGPHSRSRHLHRGRGTTPACAGTTSSWRAASSRPWDHPRVRGDHAEGAADDAAGVVRLMPFCAPQVSLSRLRWKERGSAFRGVGPGARCGRPAQQRPLAWGLGGFEEVAEVGDVGFDGGDLVRGGCGVVAAGGVCVVAGAAEAVGQGFRRAWAAAVGAFDQ